MKNLLWILLAAGLVSACYSTGKRGSTAQHMLNDDGCKTRVFSDCMPSRPAKTAKSSRTSSF